MIALYNNDTIRAIDRYAIDTLGLSELFLMEQAGMSVVQSVLNNYGGRFSSALVVCGKGNNGGDGFVVADLLADNDISVTVLHFPDAQYSDTSRYYFDKMKNSGEVTLLPMEEVFTPGFTDEFDIIIDALLGSGAKFPVTGKYAEIIKQLNISCAPKVAVDIPTGVEGSKGDAVNPLKADLTVSLAGLKQGLFIEKGRTAAGKVEFGSIGIREELPASFSATALLCEPSDINSMLPDRPVDLHKYKAGKVLIFAGSEQYPGAAALSARGVLYSGAGAVYSALPESMYSYGNLHLPEEVIPLFYPGEAEKRSDAYSLLSERAQWADAVCLGPGCGKDAARLLLAEQLIKESGQTITVLDADALTLFADNEYTNFNLKNSIITPHSGEFSRMLGISTETTAQDILKYGQDFVETTGSVLLYKSHRSIVFSAGSLPVVIPSGNNGLAKFGSGDVLAGIVTSFAAQMKQRREAAIVASYLHGLSADLLQKRHTEFGYTAVDVARTLGEAIKVIKENSIV